MTDKSHLEAFADSKLDPLARALVDAFIAGHRDAAVKTADLITKLKEEMERALYESDAVT